MRLRAFAVAAVLALFPCTALAAPQTNGGLVGGGSYVMYRDATAATAALSLWFRAPSAGYDGASPGLARLAAAAAAAAPLESGRSLAQFVRSVGGTLTIDVFPDITGISVVVPTSLTRRAVASLTAAYFAPAITASALKDAQSDVALVAVQQRYTADAVLHDALFAEIFSRGAAHESTLPASMSALSAITLDDVSAFAKRAFRSNNALFALTGGVDDGDLSAVSTNGASQGPAVDAPIDSTLAPQPPPSTSEKGMFPATGIAWVGPPIRDQRAATALDFISDYLFHAQTGVMSKAYADSNDTDVEGQFITLHDPGVFLVTVGGAQSAEAKQHILDAIARLAQPIDANVFAAAREAFLFHIASDLQTPLERAETFGWYASEGNAVYAPGDASETYVKLVRELDAAYVASVARTYLTRPIVVELVPPPKGTNP